MPKRTPLDWKVLERELNAAGVFPEEIDAGARQLLAQARNTSSPRPASSWAWARSRSPPP
jgi:hypothetical protein